MCKFHKDVARAIATDPATGAFDPGMYGVALTAIAMFRIEQYMPTMFGTDGYDRYRLASAQGVKAFSHSRLANAQPQNDAAALRAAMLDVATRHNLTTEALNLPKDPVKDVAFLDEATVDLFDGYNAPGYAAGVLSFKAQAHKAAFEPIRAAAADFVSLPGVQDALQTAFEHSVTKTFREAKAQANPLVLKMREMTGGGLTGLFKKCAMCTRDGVSAAAVSHIGCVVIPMAAASAGAAVSTTFLTAFMLVTSPALAGGATWFFDRMRGMQASALKIAGSMTIAFGIAVGVSMMGGHDGHATDHNGGHGSHTTHEHHGAHVPQQAQAWLDTLDEAEYRQAEENAAMMKMTIVEYALSICGENPAIYQEMEIASQPPVARL